jgi:hypothetical protein
MDWQFDKDNDMTRGFQHLHIAVDDVADENLIRYFPQAVNFIHQGLNHWPRKTSSRNDSDSSDKPGDTDQGSGVLIHW